MNVVLFLLHITVDVSSFLNFHTRVVVCVIRRNFFTRFLKCTLSKRCSLLIFVVFREFIDSLLLGNAQASLLENESIRNWLNETNVRDSLVVNFVDSEN